MKALKYKILGAAHQANYARLLATPRGVAVGQFSLLAASGICLVWGTAEPVICPSKIILHDAPNGQTASTTSARMTVSDTHAHYL